MSSYCYYYTVANIENDDRYIFDVSQEEMTARHARAVICARRYSDVTFHFRDGQYNPVDGRFYVFLEESAGDRFAAIDHRRWHPRDEVVQPMFPYLSSGVQEEVRTWLLVARRLGVNRDVARDISAYLVNTEVQPPYRTPTNLSVAKALFYRPYRGSDPASRRGALSKIAMQGVGVIVIVTQCLICVRHANSHSDLVVLTAIAIFLIMRAITLFHF